jgi:hypothetical protein
LKDIERSKERHILHYTATGTGVPDFSGLPVWSAVEAWSFSTVQVHRARCARCAGGRRRDQPRCCESRVRLPRAGARLRPQPLCAPQSDVASLRHRRWPDA